MPKSAEVHNESVIGENLLAAKTKTSSKAAKEKKAEAKPKLKFDRHKVLFFSFLAIFILGANLLAIGLIYKAYLNTTLSFEVAPVTQLDISQRRSTPVRVEIPSQSIDLPIFEAKIVKGIWETSEKGATHLDTSARPGESGNTVIYGHNLLRLFGRIQRMKDGDLITVRTQDGGSYTYVVTQTQVVKPNQIDVVLPTKYEVLTLYTCTGFLDSQRFVIHAKPV